MAAKITTAIPGIGEIPATNRPCQTGPPFSPAFSIIYEESSVLGGYLLSRGRGSTNATIKDALDLSTCDGRPSGPDHQFRQAAAR